MAERSGFFNSRQTGGSYDSTYNADDFSNVFRQFLGNGIMVTDEEAEENTVFDKTTCHGLKTDVGNKNIMVSSGWAFLNGYWYHNDGGMTIDVPSSYTNFKLLLSLDVAGREIRFVFMTWDGTEGSLQQTESEEIYELLIATGTRQADGTITNYTDRREKFITTSLKVVQNIANNVKESFKDRFYVFETSSSVSVQEEGVGVESIVDSVNLPAGFGNNDTSKVCVIFAGVEKQLTVDGKNKYTLRGAYNKEVLSYSSYGSGKIESYVSPSISGVENVVNRIVVPMRVYYNRDDYMKGDVSSVLTIYRRYVFLDLS